MLLRWECRNRFKLTLLFSSYFWLVADASARGPSYLLNCLVLDHTFFKILKIFFAKVSFSENRHQITYFLWSPEENGYADIKYPINLKHPQKLLLMRILTQRVVK